MTDWYVWLGLRKHMLFLFKQKTRTTKDGCYCLVRMSSGCRQDVVRMSSGCLLALESLVFLSLGFFVFTFLRLKEIQCDCIDRERFLNRSFGHTSQLKSCSCKVSWHGLRCKQQKQLRQCRPMTSHGAEEQQFQPGHTYLLWCVVFSSCFSTTV